jgi:hypothetical protein
LIEKIGATKWKDLPTATLEAVHTVLNPKTETEE